MAVTIPKMPPGGRPRERLYQSGVAALSDAELLALVIRSGRRGASALEVASEILGEHGSLPMLGKAKPEELQRLSAVGSAKAAGIIAAFELGRRAAVHEGVATISCPSDLAAAVKPHLGDARREEAFLVALSGGNRLRKVERLGLGGLTSCGLEVREVLSAALRLDAAAFGLVHSHPSGDPSPSAEDKTFTKLVSEAADRVGLRFLDHVIVAGTRWVSLTECGRYLSSRSYSP